MTIRYISQNFRLRIPRIDSIAESTKLLDSFFELSRSEHEKGRYCEDGTCILPAGYQAEKLP